MKPRLLKALQETAGKIDFMSADLSFRRLREVASRIADLHEANAESTFGYLLKSAVHEFANNQYQNVPVIYTNFVAMIDSKRRSEVYGGLYRPNLPEQVDAGERFKDTSFKGFERELVNYKYGLIETFERELFDDDQTGQVRSRAANLGEGFKIFEEIYVLSRLMGLAQTVEGVTVPASTYNSGTLFSTTIGNRPATYTLLSAAALEAAHVAMRTMTDPMGRKFLVTPTQLIVSVKEEFLAWTLVNSPAQANTGTSATAAMMNPLQGRYTVFASPFIKEYAWAIGEPKRGLVFQRRDPMEITQEQTQSGDSFRMEVYAFRARERFECDWIEPRFLYMGNDGSVTS